MSATVIMFPARQHEDAAAAAPTIAVADVRRVVSAVLTACWQAREGGRLHVAVVDDLVTLARQSSLDRKLASDASDLLVPAIGWLVEARDTAHAAAMARDAGPLLLFSGGERVRWTEIRFGVEDLIDAVEVLRARAAGSASLHLHAADDEDDGDEGVPG